MENLEMEEEGQEGGQGGPGWKWLGVIGRICA